MEVFILTKDNRVLQVALTHSMEEAQRNAVPLLESVVQVPVAVGEPASVRFAELQKAAIDSGYAVTFRTVNLITPAAVQTPEENLTEAQANPPTEQVAPAPKKAPAKPAAAKE